MAGPQGGGERSGRERSPTTATVADLGLTRKTIHEARQLRDAYAGVPVLSVPRPMKALRSLAGSWLRSQVLDLQGREHR